MERQTACTCNLLLALLVTMVIRDSGVNSNLFFGGGERKGEILPGRFSYSNKKILSPRFFIWKQGDRPQPSSPGIDATVQGSALDWRCSSCS